MGALDCISSKPDWPLSFRLFIIDCPLTSFSLCYPCTQKVPCFASNWQCISSLRLAATLPEPKLLVFLAPSSSILASQQNCMCPTVLESIQPPQQLKLGFPLGWSKHSNGGQATASPFILELCLLFPRRFQVARLPQTPQVNEPGPLYKDIALLVFHSLLVHKAVIGM